MQLAMEEKGYNEFLHMAAQEEDGVYTKEEHISTNETHVYGMYYRVICCAHTLCPQCMCGGHFVL
jgi:hypothetical protein